MKNKIHTDSTLNKMTKAQMIEYIKVLEHNNKTLTESFEVQYQNCLNMVNDMSQLNYEFKKSRELKVNE